MFNNSGSSLDLPANPYFYKHNIWKIEDLLYLLNIIWDSISSLLWIFCVSLHPVRILCIFPPSNWNVRILPFKSGDKYDISCRHQRNSLLFCGRKMSEISTKNGRRSDTFCSEILITFNLMTLYVLRLIKSRNVLAILIKFGCLNLQDKWR